MKHFWRALAAGAVLSGLCPAVAAQEHKQLIATGWDQVTTAELRAHLPAMEQRPFDGVALSVHGRDERGRQVPLHVAFGKQPWPRAWFGAARVYKLE